jgi:hypothetical protein
MKRDRVIFLLPLENSFLDLIAAKHFMDILQARKGKEAGIWIFSGILWEHEQSKKRETEECEDALEG